MNIVAPTPCMVDAAHLSAVFTLDDLFFYSKKLHYINVELSQMFILIPFDTEWVVPCCLECIN